MSKAGFLFFTAVTAFSAGICFRRYDYTLGALYLTAAVISWTVFMRSIAK